MEGLCRGVINTHPTVIQDVANRCSKYRDNLLVNFVNFTVIEIGVGLTAGGIGFILLGCILFFDRGLLAMGNVRICLFSPLSTNWT